VSLPIAAVLTLAGLVPRSSAQLAAAAPNTLYSFCTVIGCTDGENPQAGLIMDKSGNLYGTTTAGGAHFQSGTVFKLTPNATKTKWTETALYSFSTLTGCTDGAQPEAGLIMDS
jgi:uncharacterized repeat protein (TIGR03803 family)